MRKGKDLMTVEKPKITKLFGEGMSTLEISKELCRDYLRTTKAVRNLSRELEVKEKVLRTCFLVMNIN